MQENNRSELERLDKERHADFLNMLKGFVLNQVPFIFLALLMEGYRSYLGSIYFLFKHDFMHLFLKKNVLNFVSGLNFGLIQDCLGDICKI